MLKLLLDNQKTLQKKLDDQQKELTTLRNVSEEDSLDGYDIVLGSVEHRPRRRKKKPRTGRLSEITGYDADLPIALEPAPTHSQKSKFVRQSDIPDKDLVNSQLILHQENYGDPATNSKTYNANMKLATQPLSVLLGVTDGHKIIPSSCGGGHEQDQKDFVHIQTRLMTTKQKVDESEEWAEECDFTDICYYSKLKGVESDRCVDWWDGSSNNIFKTWDMLSFGEAYAWQESINRTFSDSNRTASLWLRIFVYGSSTESLRAAVKNKYSKLPPSQQGGFTYLYLTLCKMFKMTREAKESMLVFLKLFKVKGLARYTGENVLVASM